MRTAAAAITAATAVLLTLSACSTGTPSATPSTPVGTPGGTPTATSAADGREADLAAVADLLTSRPAVLGDIATGAQLEADLAALRPTLAALTDEAFAVAVAGLVSEHALVQDGHSGVFPLAQPWHLAPIQLYGFPDGWFVVRDLGGHGLLGQQVTAIDDVPVDEVIARVSTLVPADSEATVLARAPQFAITREVLSGLRIGPATAGPDAMTVTLGDGTRATLPFLTSTDYAALLPEPIPLIPPALPPVGPAAELSGTGPFGSRALDDPPALLVVYDRVVSLAAGTSVSAFADSVRQAATELPDGAPVIVDLRRNPGGDIQTAHPLVDALGELAEQRPVRVLVGRATYSAAALVAARLRAAGAELWGQATGGGPNAIGNARAHRLPRSGLVVHLGAQRAIGVDPADRSGTLQPDHIVATTADAHFAGADPVLEAAVSGRAG